MLYFNTRSLARAFANKTGHKFTDNGKNADRRWGVHISK